MTSKGTTIVEKIFSLLLMIMKLRQNSLYLIKEFALSQSLNTQNFLLTAYIRYFLSLSLLLFFLLFTPRFY